MFEVQLNWKHGFCIHLLRIVPVLSANIDGPTYEQYALSADHCFLRWGSTHLARSATSGMVRCWLHVECMGKIPDLQAALMGDESVGQHAFASQCADAVLASLRNELSAEDGIRELQDTNDFVMVNTLRRRQYSVISRVPGGELTPQELILLVAVALCITDVRRSQKRNASGFRREHLAAARYLGGHHVWPVLFTTRS